MHAYDSELIDTGTAHVTYDRTLLYSYFTYVCTLYMYVHTRALIYIAVRKNNDFVFRSTVVVFRKTANVICG